MGCIMVREILNHRPRHYRRAVLQGEDRNRIKGGMPIVELSMLGIHQAINFMAILVTGNITSINVFNQAITGNILLGTCGLYLFHYHSHGVMISVHDFS
ncbi:uncharacterized protein LOC131063472 isoform X2 [Cryptomeria japonica]|uniref:uncharacterized protein LOC131063472 isoform X2 n=1 Tax=Cryptomeria japonica TaxID=3369 RepID=UPI0027DA8C99|nr:uncharacterized protein LOC131063472 isoform X2 [Cryptomeria japonica]